MNKLQTFTATTQPVVVLRKKISTNASAIVSQIGIIHLTLIPIFSSACYNPFFHHKYVAERMLIN